MTTVSPAKRNYAPGGGFSIRGAARELGTTSAQINAMIELKQLRVVTFGSKIIVPPSEVTRLKQLLEIEE